MIHPLKVKALFFNLALELFRDSMIKGKNQEFHLNSCYSYRDISDSPKTEGIWQLSQPAQKCPLVSEHNPRVRKKIQT
jgi:hypothetical protein